MSYLDANFGGASESPTMEKKPAVNWWWWIVGAGISALILVAIFRPQWLAKISTGTVIVGNLNPMGWV